MAALRRNINRFFARMIGLWVRPEVSSTQTIETLRALQADPAVRLCYVLETGGLADSATLASSCRRLGLASPEDPLEYANVSLGRSLVVLRKLTGWFLRRRTTQQSARLTRLMEAAVAARDADAANVDNLPVYLVPVGIYWGRAPGRERGWFTLLFNEDWEVAGRLRKAFTTLLHGRHTLLQFSEPMALAPILREDLDAARTLRMTSRVLRVHFRLRREATVGPDLSHRRTLVGEVVADPAVRELIAAAGAPGSRARDKAARKARDYGHEIAADLSYSTVRILERVLSWLWNRIYDGVELRGMERLHAVAEGNELVYVPCHRSHFDYLLLSYVLYKQGLSLPYIAAGINLNLPVVGGILRRGGAFFLRRTFSGNRLYASVFHAYVKALQTRGYPMEYFIEGGRSRTGRLLAPKGGMLSMTVQAYRADHRRPVQFVPVYFGYERLIEGTAFISELRGDGKKKESLFGLLRSLRALRENFGHVYVNIGEPIDLGDMLEQHAPGWQDTPVDDEGGKPAWLSPLVGALGEEIMLRINSAAAVTPVSMLALALLGTPRQALALADLRYQLELYRRLYDQTPYSECATLPDMTADEIIAHGKALEVIRIETHPLGDIVHLPAEQAALLTYFRNNILHLTAIHSLIAASYIHGRALGAEEIERIVALAAPYLRSELRMRWTQAELPKVVRIVLKVFTAAGLLLHDGDVYRRPPAGAREAHALSQLGQAVVPALQRYFLALVLMHRHGSGTLTQAALEEMCQVCAERLSILYGIRSPDFFDKRLFRGFVSTLRETGVVSVDADGYLEYRLNFERLENDARRVLGEPLRQAILVVAETQPTDSAEASVMTTPVAVVSFYQFTRVADPRALGEAVRAAASSADLLGTAIVASEGLNATLAGRREALDELLDWVGRLPGFDRPRGRWSVAEMPPFRRLRIKYRDEIVSYGRDDVNPADGQGEHVGAQRWNELLDDPDTLVIDTRNDYEIEIGTFPGAVDPGTRNFREFAHFVAESLADQPERPIAMFCTGGIRCEKATAVMRSMGFRNLYQLDGGILGYLDAVSVEDGPDNRWAGECFVFDERVAVDQSLEPGDYAQCHGCRRALAAEDVQHPDYEPGICCARCRPSLTAERRAQLEERRRQVALAESRGTAHIGATYPVTRSGRE